MKLRCLDRITGEVVKVEKIAFHLGRPHILNDHSINRYDVQRWDEEEQDWLPESLRFED